MPAVKYRGIFFNDEAPRSEAGRKKSSAAMNHEFYTKVFELLLRLKANFLWPAMWNNAFAADDPLNAKLADEYGIVMGTSHEEPMMRAEKEWNVRRHQARGTIRRIRTRSTSSGARGWSADKNYEEVVTLGMRGEGDTPMSASANTELLEKIVADQTRDSEADGESGPDQGSAGVGALQGSAELLREGDARARRRDAALVRRQLGRSSPAAHAPRSASVQAAPEFTTTSIMWAAREIYKWLNTNPIPKSIGSK